MICITCWQNTSFFQSHPAPFPKLKSILILFLSCILSCKHKCQLNCAKLRSPGDCQYHWNKFYQIHCWQIPHYAPRNCLTIDDNCVQHNFNFALFLLTFKNSMITITCTIFNLYLVCLQSAENLLLYQQFCIFSW